MSEEHHTNYVKIWGILVTLLVVSVVGPMAEIRWLTLVTAFGIACVKAYLVAKYFMHLNLTPKFVTYTMVTCLVFVFLFFTAVAPDVMKSTGANWEKPLWIEHEVAAAAGHGAPAAHGHEGGHSAHEMGTKVATRESQTMGPTGDGRRTPLVPHGLLGMVLFVLAEAMLFAGLISTFSITKASAVVWPPPDQPRLPMIATSLNTLVLLGSGFFLYRARLAFHRGDRAGMGTPLRVALGLGVFFVLFQGTEWVRLISQGLTLTSSTLGSFFYLIVGMHALHAVGAIALLGYATLRLHRGWLTPSLFGASEVFWYFVVGLWPILFGVVYW